MGRRPWATKEQSDFLENFVPNLDREKGLNGLKAYYDQISVQFLQIWLSEPTNMDREKAASTGGGVQAVANARRTGVCHHLSPSLMNEC